MPPAHTFPLKPLPDESWADRGLCREHLAPALEKVRRGEMTGDQLDQVNLWFPRRGDNGKTSQAVDICKRCPVRAECLTHALVTRESQGVWATSERERKRLRRLINNGMPVADVVFLAIGRRVKKEDVA